MIVQIHFLDMPRSEAIDAKIRERVEQLARFSSDIVKCEVRVQSPHGHHRKGSVNALHIRLTVPGEEIVIERQPSEDDVYVSIRDAFDAARRKVEDYERRRRGKVKTHPRARGVAAPRRQIPVRSERV